MAHTVASWKVLAAAISFAVMATGCAPGPGYPQSEGASVDPCKQLMADPQIDPIRDKIAVPIVLGMSQDVAFLSNRDRPTDAERAAIKVLWDAHEACRALTEARSGPVPRYRAWSNQAVGALLGDLHEGAITYGQFARKLLYIGAQDNSAKETLEEELAARARWRLMDDPRP